MCERRWLLSNKNALHRGCASKGPHTRSYTDGSYDTVGCRLHILVLASVHTHLFKLKPSLVSSPVNVASLS